MLGAANGLDSTLHNASNGTVNFATTDGQSFYLFAPDLSPSVFPAGTQVRVQARLADGSSTTADVTIVALPTLTTVTPSQGALGQTLTVTLTGSNFQTGAASSFGPNTTVTQTSFGSATSLTATVVIAANATPGPRNVTVTNPGGSSATLPGGFTIAAAPPTPPTLSLSYEGKLRDRVGKANALSNPDGQLDATFKVTVQPGSGPRTVTQLELWTLNGSGRWDTISTTSQWMLGAADGLDSTLHNASNGTVNFATTDGQSFYLFAPDLSPSVFPAGTQVRIQARLADGSNTTADVTIP